MELKFVADVYLNESSNELLCNDQNHFNLFLINQDFRRHVAIENAFSVLRCL